MLLCLSFFNSFRDSIDISLEKALDIYTIQKLLKIFISMSIGFYMLDMVLKYAVYVQRISVYRSLRICFRGSQEFTIGAYFPKYIKISA